MSSCPGCSSHTVTCVCVDLRGHRYPTVALLRGPDAPRGALQGLRVLSLSGQRLTLVDVRGMAALQSLDVSRNKLAVRGVPLLILLVLCP